MFTTLFRRINPRAAGSRRFVSSSSSTFLGLSRGPRVLRFFALATTLSTTAYTVGAFYPPPLLTYIAPRAAPPPPDPSLPESQAYVVALEEELQKLPILLKHRATEDPEAWYETRPYGTIPEDRRVNNLTVGALRGPGRLALLPLVRARVDESESLVIVHVGRGLCGHDGIVHGGLLATLLDETLARTVSTFFCLYSAVLDFVGQALLNLPEKVGVTANLSINYRAPTRADQVASLYLSLGSQTQIYSVAPLQFIVFRIHLLEATGRKARVSATIEDLDGNVLLEAS
jgi:acyl-coenzyme A thioesterase PaaI-like protein